MDRQYSNTKIVLLCEALHLMRQFSATFT